MSKIVISLFTPICRMPRAQQTDEHILDGKKNCFLNTPRVVICKQPYTLEADSL